LNSQTRFYNKFEPLSALADVQSAEEGHSLGKVGPELKTQAVLASGAAGKCQWPRGQSPPKRASKRLLRKQENVAVKAKNPPVWNTKRPSFRGSYYLAFRQERKLLHLNEAHPVNIDGTRKTYRKARFQMVKLIPLLKSHLRDLQDRIKLSQWAQYLEGYFLLRKAALISSHRQASAWINEKYA
jgi:hypothetical protein